MLEKIFVLGSNSFTASHFINHALSENLEVVGVSRSEELDSVFLPYKQNTNGKFQFYKLNINENLDEIMELINEFKPDYIINFSAQGMVEESWKRPEQWLTTNFLSAVKFHDRLRSYSGLKRYIQSSTPEVYGSTIEPVNENAGYNPSTPYAVSKAACDMSLNAWFSRYNFPVILTRAANVYGPGQQLYRIIPRTIMYIKQGKKLSLHGGGKVRRSFIYITDVSKAILGLARNGESGQAYHLATNQIVTISDVVNLICKKMDVNFSDHVKITDTRGKQDDAYLMNSDKVRQQLLWNDDVSLEQGIEKTISWVDKNFNQLLKQPENYVHKA